MKKIYCKNKKLRKDNPYELFESFFRPLKGPMTTYYSKSDKVQCKQDAGRSFGDLLRLGRHYFPNLKKKQLASILMKLGNEGKLGVVKCGDIKALSFYRRNKGWYNMFKTAGYTDRFTEIQRKEVGSKDGLSFNKIKEMAEAYEEDTSIRES